MARLAWTQLLRSVVDLAMPAQCVNCGEWESWLCPDCSSRVGGELLRREISVGETTEVTLQAVSATPYCGIGERVVIAQKQRGLRPLALVMAAWLAPTVRSIAPRSGPTWLVPVPATARSLRKRGRDPMLEVCQATSGLLGPQVTVVEVLAWRKRAHAQKKLSRNDRSKNVAGKVMLRPRLGEETLVQDADPTLILVDDVVTTGATLGECARALSEAGMVCSGAATVCAVEGES